MAEQFFKYKSIAFIETTYTWSEVTLEVIACISTRAAAFDLGHEYTVISPISWISVLTIVPEIQTTVVEAIKQPLNVPKDETSIYVYYNPFNSV